MTPQERDAMPHGVVVSADKHGMVEIVDDFTQSTQTISPDNAKALAAALIEAAGLADERNRKRRLHNEATSRVADDAGPAGSAMRLRREVSTLRAQVRNADRALATANERIASLESCLREALYNLRELVKEHRPDSVHMYEVLAARWVAALTLPAPKAEESAP